MPSPRPTGPATCGMCARLCWRCQNDFDRAVADLDRLEEEWASLRLAYAEADDSAAPVISDQLADVQDAIDEARDGLTAMEEGEWR